MTSERNNKDFGVLTSLVIYDRIFNDLRNMKNDTSDHKGKPNISIC